jgi:hypothetical protein
MLLPSWYAMFGCVPRSAVSGGAHAFEPLYNGALLAFKLGDFQEAFDLVGEGVMRVTCQTNANTVCLQIVQPCWHIGIYLLHPKLANPDARPRLLGMLPSGYTFAPTLYPGCVEPMWLCATGCPRVMPTSLSLLQVSKALECYPDHSDSQELMKQLRAQLTML